MDFTFFQELLSIDSTSGKERKVAEWLAERLPGMFPAANRPVLRAEEVGDGTLNLLLTWGTPRIVFCSHLDTVPPYIEPVVADEVIKGRGSCDAKGQVFAIVEACKRLAEEGKTDFGMLLLAGEETGSWGAKAFAKTDFRAEYLVVGEPTDNCMVSASKGTKSFDLKFTGEPFHSDSDNPQNILSPELTCRLYFRTTFVSDEAVCQWMAEAQSGRLAVTARGGDTPARYWTVEGLPSKSVAFGSDAPHLKNFTHKAICGPGSITVAHRDDEHVLVADLATAVEQYLALYRSVTE